MLINIRNLLYECDKVKRAEDVEGVIRKSEDT